MKSRIALVLISAAGFLAAQTPATKKTAAPRAAATASYKDLKFPPLRQVQIPSVETHTLPNGMKLYLLENHELPLVSGFALIRAGNLFDPADKVGLASMTGMVMRTGGTRTQTGDALDEKLENVAASVESSIDETHGRVSFSALKENTAEVLAAFYDIMTAPEFRQDKIELARTRLRSSIARRNDDPHGIVQREFSDILYGRDNPYGWRTEYEHIDRITRDDLVAFHRRYFFPENVMLAVHGDFKSAEMKAQIEKLFAGWTVKQPAVPPFPPVTNKAKPGAYLAAKTDVTQTFFALGHIGGLLKDKDYPALEVMADILGGGFRSRLFERVRTKLGKAYSISASWGANYNHPGTFEISGSTESLSTVETLQLVEEEVGRIRDNEVTDEELRVSKDAVQNSFVFHFDTRAKTLGRLMNYEYYGYPKDFLFQYQKGIAAVTKADVLRVARERLNPKDFVIVAVGNPKDFGKPLSTLGRPVSEIDLTIPEPKKEMAKADAASLARGKQLLAKVQAAVGGTAKLAAVKDTLQVAEVQLDASMGGTKIKQVNRWALPGVFRQEVELPFGKVTSFSDGKTGWIAVPNQGDRPLPAAQLKQVQSEIFRNYFSLLLSDRDPNRTVNYAAAGVLEISDKEGNSTRLTVDEATGMPQKETYAGPQGPLEETWSNFKDVGGVKVPHQISVTTGGRKFADAVILELSVNTGATAEQLSKRP